ncbi:hypothetical protein IYY11_00720 [Methylocystis sp. H62]|jgi:hypothetical protein|uniref:hypothetical protein n=1 Tax=Methylocystis sp. H62 TaxID=2785789 RepID=UPI0018C22AF6|nr:hypothetical protein [Methylocystis sp. H62]MBG0792023.1 hypothetical protein [Methylocystis sp. H62]
MIFARLAVILTCGLLTFSLAGGAALAQDAPSSGGAFIGRIFDATGLRTPPPPAQDFVRDSRSEQLEYRGFEATPAKDPKRKAAAHLRGMSAELDAAAAENRRRAGRVAAPDAPARPAR